MPTRSDKSAILNVSYRSPTGGSYSQRGWPIRLNVQHNYNLRAGCLGGARTRGRFGSGRSHRIARTRRGRLPFEEVEETPCMCASGSSCQCAVRHHGVRKGTIEHRAARAPVRPLHSGGPSMCASRRHIIVARVDVKRAARASWLRLPPWLRSAAITCRYRPRLQLR